MNHMRSSNSYKIFIFIIIIIIIIIIITLVLYRWVGLDLLIRYLHSLKSNYE